MQGATDEDVQQLLNVIGLDETVARRALRAHGSSGGNGTAIEKVFEEYFTNEAAFIDKYQWDSSALATDHDGNSAGTGFNTESSPGYRPAGSGTYADEYYSILPPSRPPSQNADTSLARTIDAGQWQELKESLGKSRQGKSLQDEDDVALQKAIDESVAESRGVRFVDQETGVVDADISMPVFGPATRDVYDPDKWGMVLHQGAAKEPEQTLDIPPSQRKRSSEAPPFLVGSSKDGDHRLGGLLTMLHAVPLARNLLLRIGRQAQDCAHDTEWWKGKRAAGADPAEGNRKDAAVVDEIHRLMAFLDRSERSHASVWALADILDRSGGEHESLLFETIRDISPDVVIPHFFGVSDVPLAPELRNEGGSGGGGGGGDEDAGKAVHYFAIADPGPIDFPDIKYLEEVWDHFMWSDGLGTKNTDQARKFQCRDKTMSVLEQLGEFVVVRITDSDPIELPLVWYPERYRAERKADAVAAQRDWFDTKTSFWRHRKLAKEMTTYFCRAHDRTEDITESCTRIIASMKMQNERVHWAAKADAYLKNGPPPDFRHESIRYTLYEEEEAEIKQREEVIKARERDLEHQAAIKAELAQELDYIDGRRKKFRTFLNPDPLASTPVVTRPYYLRGVATGKNTVFLCRRREAPLVDMGDNDQAPLDQWWKLTHDNLSDQDASKLDAAQEEDTPKQGVILPRSAPKQGGSQDGGHEHGHAWPDHSGKKTPERDGPKQDGDPKPAAESPVRARKVSVEEVMESVLRDSRTCLVLYATEKAVSTPADPIPDPLLAFVAADNESFRRELELERLEADSRRLLAGAPSPSKRKRSASADSFSSNKAFMGDSDIESDPGAAGSPHGTRRRLASAGEAGAAAVPRKIAAAAAAAADEVELLDMNSPVKTVELQSDGDVEMNLDAGTPLRSGAPGPANVPSDNDEDTDLYSGATPRPLSPAIPGPVSDTGVGRSPNLFRRSVSPSTSSSTIVGAQPESPSEGTLSWTDTSPGEGHLPSLASSRGISPEAEIMAEPRQASEMQMRDGWVSAISGQIARNATEKGEEDA